jgi:polysaccharide export outer membrane protein
MKKLVVIAFIGFISLSSFSQSGPADKAQIPGSNSVAQRPTSVATADPAYTIGAEDVINIAVWKEPDFSATVPVRPDGKVSLALIGDIQAAGKTPAEMAEDLTALLKKYIAEPRVTVMVTAMNSRRVFLLGEISRPGPIVITPAMNVLQAIAAAGGPTAYANSKKCYVLRTVNGTQTKLPFNYKEALKGNSPEQNVLLKSGDTIVVP